MTDWLSTPKPLSETEIKKRKAEAAKRALAEAAARRAAAARQADAARRAAQDKSPLPKELGGQPGPEPTRYGDWEKKGMICDF